MHGKALQPTVSNRSKAAEAGGFSHNQSIMATIADDDDRLLVRIGYTPVRSLDLHPKSLLILVTGITTTLFKMVDRLIRDFDSWCLGLSPSYLRSPNGLGRTRNSSVGMVHR